MIRFPKREDYRSEEEYNLAVEQTKISIKLHDLLHNGTKEEIEEYLKTVFKDEFQDLKN